MTNPVECCLRVSTRAALAAIARFNTDAPRLAGSPRLGSVGVVAVAWVLACGGGVAGSSPCDIPSTSVFLQPQVPETSGNFGRAVAVDGDWIAVGAVGIASQIPGHVELFHRVDGAWIVAGTISPADATPGDDFGNSIAMHGDTLLVGARTANGATSKSGAAYVFRLLKGTWQEEAKLVLNDGQTSDGFGDDVALAGDHALVGASGRDDFGASSGAAYLFTRIGTRWMLDAALTAPDAADGDKFGIRVELDDNVAAISAPGDDDAGSTVAGSVRVFERGAAGWAQVLNINAAETPFPSESGLLGVVVSMRQGTLLINANFGGSSSTGTLLEYVRTTDGWAGPRLVVAPGGEILAPRSLRLGPTGDVAVWSSREEPSGKTALMVLRRDGAGWYAEQEVAPPLPLPDDFNASVVAFDGSTMLFGRRMVVMGGVPTGVVFVADLPPRDADQNGLDDACELATGLTEDCDGDGIIDSAQLPFRHVADNVEGAWSPSSLSYYGAPGSNVLVLNHFAVTGTTELAVRSIGFVVPNLPPFPFFHEPIAEAIAVVYADPNGDGNPADAVLLSAQTVTFPAESEWSVLTDFPIQPVDVGPPGTSFFAGFAMELHYYGQRFTQTDDAPPHRQAGWLTGSESTLVLDDLSLNPLKPIELLFDSGVFAHSLPIRVNLSDCDDSQTLDVCEIADGVLADLDGDLVPDLCQPAPGDLDGDGDVDGADASILLGEWGACPGLPAGCAADLNGDGVVGGADLGMLLHGWTG